MSTLIHNLYYNSIKNRQSTNLLCFTTDGWYENILAETFHQHNFFCISPDEPQLITKILPKPSNVHWLSTNEIPFHINFDALLCHERTNHFDVYAKTAFSFHIPIICVEHTIPQSIRQEDVYIIGRTRKPHISISTSQFVADFWQRPQETIIPYKTPEILTLQDKQDKQDKIITIGQFPKLDTTYEITKFEDIKNWTEFTTRLLISKFVLINQQINPLYMIYGMGAECKVICNSSEFNEQFMSEAVNDVYCYKSIQDINTLLQMPYKHNTCLRTKDEFCESWTKIFQQTSNYIYTVMKKQ